MSDNQRNIKAAERVGSVQSKADKPIKQGPDFSTLFAAWVESHRASLVDSLGRLGRPPSGRVSSPGRSAASSPAW